MLDEGGDLLEPGLGQRPLVAGGAVLAVVVHPALAQQLAHGYGGEVEGYPPLLLLEAKGLAFWRQRAKIGCLNWRLNLVERETGLEPATLCLGSRCSTN